jgi:hypothetical protein
VLAFVDAAGRGVLGFGVASLAATSLIAVLLVS